MAAILKFKNRPAHGLFCSGCGATAKASCNCGKPYIPAGERAAQAIEENPELSDRAIADEIGVGKDTIRRARKTGGAKAPRRGRDGKTYKAKKPRPAPSDIDQANAMMRKAQALTEKYSATLSDWLKTKPEPGASALDALANVLELCAEKFTRMSIHIDKLGRKQDDRKAIAIPVSR